MGRIFACSDLHGHYELWEKIKSFLKPDDKLYFLGDAADRRPDGYQIMKDMLLDKRIVYLMGNHEDFFVKGCTEYFKNYPDPLYDIVWLYMNGGQNTFDSFCKDTLKICKSVVFLTSKLSQREDLYIKDKHIILSHAGCDPNDGDPDYLWDRYHYVHEWPEGYKNTYVIHGHTPTPFLIQDLKKLERPFTISEGAVIYADGHKIDIDLGCFSTNKTVLIDLETFEIIPIESDKEQVVDNFWK